ncbi:MAG: hypothetical protein ABI851_09905 [Saprospiraceae bacterium]
MIRLIAKVNNGSNMKNIIILVLLCVSTIIDAQTLSYSVNYCKTKIITIKQYAVSNNYKDFAFFVEPLTDSLYWNFKNIYFYPDSSLIELVQDSNFITYLKGNNIPYTFVFDGVISCISQYLKSLKYSNLSNPERTKLILASSDHFSLSRSISGLTVSDFISIFNEENNENRKIFLPYIFNIYTRNQIDTIFSHIDSIVLNDKKLIFTKLTYADNYYNELEKDSIKQVVKAKFLVLIDTNDIYDMENLDYVFNHSEKRLERNENQRKASELNRKNIFDSLFQIKKQMIDSVLNHHINYARMSPADLESLQKSIETGEIYNSNILEQMKPVDRSSWTAEELRRYHADHDTTLNNRGTHPGWVGDDGRSFDTLSNDELFYELSLFDYNMLMDTIHTEYGLNSNPRIIHLRKITQLIGDRYQADKLILDSSKEAELNRLFDFCELVLGIFRNASVWNTECENLVFRIWLPFRDRLYSWVTSANPSLRIFSDNFLHLMMDETMARELARLGTEQLDLGNRDLAEKYIAPLQRIDSQKEPDLDSLPPRRYALRNWDISVRWCNEFIYAALIKVGWLEEIK